MTTTQTTSKLLSLKNLNVQPSSIATTEDAESGLAHPAQLVILAPRGSSIFALFEGQTSDEGDQALLIGPTNAHNIEALRAIFPWLRPRPLGLQTSAGFGDRLGLATPGHIRALRA